MLRKTRCKESNVDALTLEQFVELNDAELYYGYTPQLYVEHLGLHSRSSSLYLLGDPLTKVASQCDVRISNGSQDIATLHSELSQLNLIHPERLLPSWDAYFMTLSHLAARRSNCMKRRVGCILVSCQRILSAGYNGTPSGTVNCNKGGCARCNGGEARGGHALDACFCLHAEENALLEVGRERAKMGQCTLYCNTSPCLACAKKIVQCGVKEVVYDQAYGMESLTLDLFAQAGVKVRQFSLLKDAAFLPPLDGISTLSIEE
jgi:dCMP deaminase